MPLLSAFASWLGGIFAGVFSWVSVYLGARAALAVAIAAAFLATTGVAFVAVQGFISGIVSASYALTGPAGEWFVIGFYSMWPSNGATVIAACLGTDVAVFLWRYKLQLINAVSSR